MQIFIFISILCVPFREKIFGGYIMVLFALHHITHYNDKGESIKLMWFTPYLVFVLL